MLSYKNYIGIDTGKKTFVVAVYDQKKVYTFPNSLEGIEQFCEQFKDIVDESLVAIETTGGYERLITWELYQRGVAIHRAHAHLIKSFGKSYGIRAKTDSVDAKLIAHYARACLYNAFDGDFDSFYAHSTNQRSSNIWIFLNL